MTTSDQGAFGELIVSQIRDRAISSAQVPLQSNAHGPTAVRYREAAKVAGHIPPEMLIVNAVDTAIFYLMKLIEDGDLRLEMVSSDTGEATQVDPEPGELAGWYLGD